MKYYLMIFFILLHSTIINFINDGIINKPENHIKIINKDTDINQNKYNNIQNNNFELKELKIELNHEKKNKKFRSQILEDEITNKNTQI